MCILSFVHLGPYSRKVLARESFCPKPAKIFVLGLVVFTKNLRPVLGLAKGSTLRRVGSGLKFCKEDLNMAAINFSPLQNLKWL